jgi:hypothetical protein
MMLTCGSSFTELLLLRNNAQELSGYTTRITEMLDFLQHEASSAGVVAAASASSASSTTSLCISRLTVSPPGDDARILIRDLDLEVPRGESILVVRSRVAVTFCSSDASKHFSFKKSLPCLLFFFFFFFFNSLSLSLSLCVLRRLVRTDAAKRRCFVSLLVCGARKAALCANRRLPIRRALK